MAIMFDYRFQFLFAFFILLVILLIYPVRAETAWNNPDLILVRESGGVQHKTWIGHSYRNLIMNKLTILSALKDQSYTIFPDTLLKDMRIDVRSSTADPIFKHGAEYETDEGISGSFQSRVRPFIEISYSLSKRIALEFTGHFSRYMNRSSLLSGNKDNLYDYTLMAGPSFHMGRLNKTTSMYTQFGLGYKFIDTDSYTLPGDCPSVLGTGLCFGLKTSRADIRIGVNHFRSFADDELYHYDYDTRLDPSLMFLFITYNFDS